MVDEDNVDARVQYATLMGIKGWMLTIEYKDDESDEWIKEDYPLAKDSGIKPSELLGSLKEDLTFTIVSGKVTKID